MHICPSPICERGHCGFRQAFSYLRFQTGEDLAPLGPLAVQDVHHSENSSIQVRGKSHECTRPMGGAGGASDGFAGKKTIVTLTETKSQSRTARILGLSPDQVHHVMQRAVEFGLKHRSSTHMYHHICIDEKAIHGRDFASILYDGDTGNVIEVMEGRKESDVWKLLDKGLTRTQRDNVFTVSMDMWDPFMKVIGKDMPFAKICHDKYHLVSYLNKAIDGVRRREVKKHEELRRTRYLFLKNMASLTDKQYMKFKSIKDADYEVSRAWRVKEDFRNIMYTRDKADAFIIFEIWCQYAREMNIPEVTKVVDMFDRHVKGIVNAMTTGRNNGRAERMNGSIQELQTVGRGYRDVEHFRTAVLFFHGGLRQVQHRSAIGRQV